MFCGRGKCKEFIAGDIAISTAKKVHFFDGIIKKVELSGIIEKTGNLEVNFGGSTGF